MCQIPALWQYHQELPRQSPPGWAGAVRQSARTVLSMSIQPAHCKQSFPGCVTQLKVFYFTMEKDPTQPHRLTTISSITDKLAKEGFTEEFVMKEEGLQAISSGEVFRSDALKIVKHYRDEGTTDPADMSIVYAVVTNNGLKGTIVSGYGPNVDSPLGEFMRTVDELPNSNNPNGYHYDGDINTTYR